MPKICKDPRLRAGLMLIATERHESISFYLDVAVVERAEVLDHCKTLQ